MQLALEKQYKSCLGVVGGGSLKIAPLNVQFSTSVSREENVDLTKCYIENQFMHSI